MHVTREIKAFPIAIVCFSDLIVKRTSHICPWHAWEVALAGIVAIFILDKFAVAVVSMWFDPLAMFEGGMPFSAHIARPEVSKYGQRGFRMPGGVLTQWRL